MQSGESTDALEGIKECWGKEDRDAVALNEPFPGLGIKD